ncbi:efflux transporter, RND family, MFP subunit [Thiorhodococcus drewsii AZ1]|uniref:Efflux transporter, RND family, MFP subunit n=1 Tax=Thiorhodococcus drewsii AZ1 TaxID=765913 RepID=G2DZ30_9GAMM|nr:efflux transporter, RND family, MFP subunit [Thiorhodococcus drewsii AZ1]
MRRFKISPSLLFGGLVLLTGCQPSAEPVLDEVAPLVVTTRIQASDASTWSLTGTWQARHEIPLSFRIGGKVAARLVDAGARVEMGQVLFRLDPRDVSQQRIAAEAQVASARAETQNAERERARLADMLKRKLTSQQEYDRAATSAQSAREQLVAAEAELVQAINATEYAVLKAPASGILLDVTGQQGQVVTAGQSLATLAEKGPLEAEVYVPEDRRAQLPTRAVADPIGGEPQIPVSLREVAGAVDPATRTWRARFTIDPAASDGVQGVALGTTLTLRFKRPAEGPGEGAIRWVPLGAVLERGDGPLVWRLVEGHVEAEAVTLLGIEGEHARIRTRLPVGTQVVALGVDRLQPGQTVRVRP